MDGVFPEIVSMWRRIRTEDRMLVALRAALLIAAALWTALAPVAPGVRWHCAALLLVFLGYGLLILWLVSRWPERARVTYLGALAADLVFLYFLFGETGGIASPFLSAAFLVAALTAFRHGPGLGALAAWSALGLAALSAPAQAADRHVSELPLMFIFVTLTAVYVGWLARREAEERRDVERLHEELSARAKDLEATYQRCKEAQDHLVHSERLATIGRMSAEMAHQVRNPLSSISLNLELLGDEIAGLNGGTAEEPRRLITAIQKEIDNLGELTESYLRFANLPPFRWESADLNEVVREILVFARPQIEQRGVTATHQLGDGLPPVRIDRRQLKFAVMNVLTNALEAMASGGRLRMRTRTNGGWVDLTISDTGPGIPKEDQARIFEPFFTTKQGGTGLGLSLTRRIVEAHGGRADCESILQVGTSFTLSLPLNGRAGMEKSNGKGDTGG